MKPPLQEIIYLSAQDVGATGVDVAAVIEIVERVLSLHDKDRVTLPPKVVLDLDEKRHGRINAMPAYVGGNVNMCGIKWIAGFPNNPVRHNLPRANALIILNDPQTGMPLAILDATRISALRTGAVTGVGARYLARADARRVAFVGAGVQARTQLQALKSVLPGINEMRIFDTRREVAQDFVNHCSASYDGVAVGITENPELAVRHADIVVTATVADEPIVKADWLKPGVFFSHVGSYQEEEEAVILQADKVVVDIWEEVLHRRTPLLARMFEAGTIDHSRIHANMGEIINGDKSGRETADERIFFSPLGLGSEDIAVAANIYQRAIDMKLGLPIPFGQS